MQSLRDFNERNATDYFWIIQYENDTEDKKRLSADIALNLLRNLKDESELYHSLRSNCECFASYCRSGCYMYEYNFLYLSEFTYNKTMTTKQIVL